jgi:predicted RND superfamily exporter protein
VLKRADQHDFTSPPEPDQVGDAPNLNRWSWLILLVTAIAFPFIINGAVRSLKVYKSDVKEWLPAGFPEAVAYESFVNTFGVDEMVVISWEGATLDDPRVPALRSMLQEQMHEDQPMFSRVLSGPEMLDQIKSAKVRPDAALSRISGLMVGLDRKTTCIVCYPNEDPDLGKGQMKVDRLQVMERIYEVAASHPVNIAPKDLKLGGPTIDGAVMDIETKKSLQRYLGLTVLAVFVIAWYRLGEFMLALIAVSFSLFATAISLSILYYGGGKMNITMILLPTMCFILGISGCVHIVNYYRNALADGKGKFAADWALRHGFKPCSLASFTTAIGMFSLGVSKIEPIRAFGFFSGIGVISGLFVILLVLPATLYYLGNRLAKPMEPEFISDKPGMANSGNRRLMTFVNWICHENAVVVICFLLVFATLSTGLFHIESSVKLQSRFSERVKILQDYEWLEEHLGPLVPMEVVLEFSPENQLSPWYKMQMVKRVERAIRRTTAVRATLSAATFEPPLPQGGRLLQEAERRTFLNKWENSLGALEDGKLLKMDGDSSYWRISTRVAAMNDLDYGVLIGQLKSNVDHQIEDLKQPGVKATVTGAIPLIYKAQHQILRDLAWSFVTAFFFISIVMMVLLKSLRGGLIAMLPNVLPPIIVFGAMGWVGKKVEIGSVLTASIALGIAVDDTIHFLVWYRKTVALGASRFRGIRQSFTHCSRAMVDTSLICAFGVAPFLFSSYMPSYNFALLLIAMMLTALAGALIFLPALLAGPTGRFFRPKLIQADEHSSTAIQHRETEKTIGRSPLAGKF